MEEEEYEYTFVTCPVEGCANYNIPVSVPDNGAPTLCGPCGNIIPEAAG